jgi:hypothetical protein
VGGHDDAAWFWLWVAVPRVRGQQLKEVAQLDGWLRDGLAEELAATQEALRQVNRSEPRP